MPTIPAHLREQMDKTILGIAKKGLSQVDSSNLHALAYYRFNEGIAEYGALLVQFKPKPGKPEEVWVYENVEPEIAAQIGDAQKNGESVGKLFNALVKSNSDYPRHCLEIPTTEQAG